MKKIISIMTAALLAFQSAAVLADEAVSSDADKTVKIVFSLREGYCNSADSTGIMALSDSENTYTATVTLSNDKLLQNVAFNLNESAVGKTFSIYPVSGIDRIFYNDEVYSQGTPVVITPERMQSSEPIHIQYVPLKHNSLDVNLNGSIVKFSFPARYVGDTVIVPIDEMAKALELGYVEENATYKVMSMVSSVTVDVNDVYVEKLSTGKVKQNLAVKPMKINGKMFVPISLFADAFNLSLSLQWTDDKPLMNVSTGVLEAPAPEPVSEPVQQPQQSRQPQNNWDNSNSYVNSAGLASDTDYLVWISKSEYKVRVYLGRQGNWNLINTFTCAIGAPSTPTCEGTYKYYQAQSKWDYKTYYVGPVMRFNGGYAIHSTLLYPNGTPKDNRVGVKISHGCIRLRPDDINWMFYYVPLKTTIHITG